MKFAIITYILHKEHNKAYYSYEPYIREMNIWLSSVDKIIVVAPKILSVPNTIESPYMHPEVSFMKIPAISFLNFRQVVGSLIKFPSICYWILKALNQADHIHLRCPGNISLIACVLQIFFPKKPKTVKYAGNWDPSSKQPWSYRLQKWILSNTFLSRNIKVLVYGDWPEQSKNIVSFFTASFSETEKDLHNKDFTSSFKFIFVGSLSPGKQPLFAIKLIEVLIGKGIPVKLEIYGSGVLKIELQEYITKKNLEPFVRLMGNYKLEELKEVYRTSHFLILASQSEGWPKAVAEAMFFGCIPISTEVSCVSWMLNYGERGILIPPRYRNGRQEAKLWMDKTVKKLIDLIEDSEEMKRMSTKGQEWSQQYTLERFEVAINDILVCNNSIIKKSTSPIGRGGKMK